MNLKTKNALIGGLLAIVFVMAVGYAAFSQVLTINGTAEITSSWDVQMTSIEATSVNSTTGSADVPYAAGTAEDGTQLVNGSTAKFKANLVTPGDSIVYTVKVKNSGDLNAKVSSVELKEDDSSSPISYEVSGISVEDSLNADGETTFTVTVSYDDVSVQPDTLENGATLTINYVQA